MNKSPALTGRVDGIHDADNKSGNVIETPSLNSKYFIS